MSWSPLLPAKRIADMKGARPAITLSTSAGSGQLAPKMSLIFRPAALDGITWLTAGAGLQVMVGGGEHKGMLRIEPNGLHMLGKVALCKPAGSLLSLKLPMLPGAVPAKREPVALEFDYQDGWIELTLPDLATAPAAEVPAPTPAEPAKPRSVLLAEQAAEIARRKAAR